MVLWYCSSAGYSAVDMRNIIMYMYALVVMCYASVYTKRIEELRYGNNTFAVVLLLV